MKRVPVLLITGFLGAGKTTFINWLMKNSPDTRISLILNEFGDIKLESQFITDKSGEIVELANGCMCCVAQKDIPRVVNYIIDHSPQTEYIVIEASGLSDPDPIQETLRGPDLNSRIRLLRVICIADAENIIETSKHNQIVSSQLGDADAVLITKTGNLSREKLDGLAGFIRNLTPGTTVYEMDDNLTPEPFLRDNAPEDTPHTPQREHHHHDHKEYQTIWFMPGKPIDQDKFRLAVDRLPEGIIRAKGVLQVMPGDKKKLFQYINLQYDVKDAKWDPDEPHRTAVVFIGQDFDEIELLRHMDSAIF
jgi:G3E family GTPase